MKLPLESITVKDRRREDYGDIAVRHRRRAIAPGQRFRILRRDGYTCRWCGQSAPDVVLEVDHVIPVNAGGSNDDSNLTTSCRECNIGKSDTTDSVRDLWREEEYREVLAMAIGQRDEGHIVAVKLAAECEVRYGVSIDIPDLPEVA